MKNQKSFDQAIKDKLAQKDFPFDESNWILAQEAIKAGQKQKRYRFAYWLLIPLVVLIVCTVFMLNKNEPIGEATRAEVSGVNQHFDSNDVSSTKTNNTTPEERSNEQTELVESQKANSEYLNQKNELQNNISTDRNSNQNSIDHVVVDDKNSTKTIYNNHKNSKIETLNKPDQIKQASIYISDNSIDKPTSIAKEEPDNNLVDVDHEKNEIVETKHDSGVASQTLTNVPLITEDLLKERSKVPPYMLGLVHELNLSYPTLENARPIPKPKSLTSWKIAVLAGPWNSSGTYSSIEAEEWMTGTREWQPAYGLEVMRQGLNFGFGSGIHYNTYAEKLDVDSNFHINQETFQHWRLVQVDTTILFITDTLNGNLYDGESIHQTINVIERYNETVSTSVKTRDSRNIYNKVNYIEIPLIADVHAGRGLWTFGLKGGPTISHIINRVGALPDADGNGYAELSEITYRKWMPGYMLRAYVSYRVAPKIYVGIEPGIRGMLGSSLQTLPYRKVNNAYGAMLSLSYRIK